MMSNTNPAELQLVAALAEEVRRNAADIPIILQSDLGATGLDRGALAGFERF
jgi:hypothetical protein